MPYRKCEICGFRSERKGGQKRYFMARFPLYKLRCKEWVKLTGKEDLAYLPIEKLHQLKFVCGKHFKDSDFNKNRTHLKKNAVPSVGLTSKPLSDIILSNFPYHLYKKQQASREDVPSASSRLDFVPVKSSERTNSSRKKQQKDGASEEDCCVPRSQRLVDVNDTQEIPEHNDSEENCVYEDDVETEDAQFSWQQPTKICIDDDDNNDRDVECVKLATTANKVQGKPSKEVNDEDHKEYICDGCSTNIVGFRYKCVQCDNYDLCQTCESKMFHAFHYMLRIPKPKPYNEINSIIEAIREKIKALTEGLQDNSVGIEEIKLEPAFEDPSADPLRATPRPETPQIATSRLTADIRPTHMNTSSIKSFKTPHKGMPLLEIPLTPMPQIQIPLTATPQMKIPLKATPHIQIPLKAMPQLQKPFITKSPAVVPQMSKQRSDITHTATLQNEELKTAPVNDTRQIPKPVSAPVMIDPMDLLKKLNLIQDNSENTHNIDDQNRKRKLHTDIEEDFDKDDVFSTADIEETWLDEEILDDESTVSEVDKDNEEYSSRTLRNTRNKNPRYTE